MAKEYKIEVFEPLQPGQTSRDIVSAYDYWVPWEEVIPNLWALAKLTPPEPAKVWTGCEWYSNGGWQDKEPPAEMRKQIEALHKLWAPKYTTGSLVSEALNDLYDRLGKVWHDGAADEIRKAVDEWLAELESCADESSGAYFDRYVAGDRR